MVEGVGSSFPNLLALSGFSFPAHSAKLATRRVANIVVSIMCLSSMLLAARWMVCLQKFVDLVPGTSCIKTFVLEPQVVFVIF